MKVAILGAGLAGAACAYILKQYDADCIVYEAADRFASQGSGNPLGLYNPRPAAEYSPEAEFYKTAFETALKTFEELDNIDWNPCGALHFMTDEKKIKRFHKMAKNWPWDETMMTLARSHEASQIAGVKVEYDALYLPQSGTVSPAKLCEAYLQDTEIHCNHAITDLSAIDADKIIIASGIGAVHLTDIPIKSVRGQITVIKETATSQPMKTALCYGGYAAPAINGQHVIGSTFQRWLDHTDSVPEDDQGNINKLIKAVPSLSDDYEVTGHRAALRATSPDHFPIIGRVDDRTYISAAHGSHGILSSLMGAHILAAMLTGQKSPVSEAIIKRLDPHRFSV